jgi:hypothetical protein
MSKVSVSASCASGESVRSYETEMISELISVLDG